MLGNIVRKNRYRSFKSLEAGVKSPRDARAAACNSLIIASRKVAVLSHTHKRTSYASQVASCVNLIGELSSTTRESLKPVKTSRYFTSSKLMEKIITVIAMTLSGNCRFETILATFHLLSLHSSYIIHNSYLFSHMTIYLYIRVRN